MTTTDADRKMSHAFLDHKDATSPDYDLEERLAILIAEARLTQERDEWRKRYEAECTGALSRAAATGHAKAERGALRERVTKLDAVWGIDV